MTEIPRSDHDLLIEIATTTKDMSKELLGGNGRTGRIPQLEQSFDEHAAEDSKRFNKIDNQLSYWKGALALGGILLLALGGVLLAHIWGGH
jgi:hypothetical protein